MIGCPSMTKEEHLNPWNDTESYTVAPIQTQEETPVQTPSRVQMKTDELPLAEKDYEEFIQQALFLQAKLNSETRRAEMAQGKHLEQGKDNKILREYVHNLLASASTTGVDKYGVPIPAFRTSSRS